MGGLEKNLGEERRTVRDVNETGAGARRSCGDEER
jgi:hypothetical protein